MPAVSVIMVFHRTTEFFRPAVRSILDQTFRDFEFILVDNGAGVTDADLGDCATDPRLRWVRLAKDEGIGVAANAGVAAAAGEFVALLDYDDLALPQRLERQVAALRADPGLGVVSAFAELVDPEGRKTGGRVFTLIAPEEFRAYAQFAAPVIHPVMMARRDVLRALPFRRQFPFASELDFYARVVEQQRLAVIPEVLLHYRWYPQQTTQRYAGSIEQSRCAICLLTARRRAGQPERIESILPLSQGMSAAEYHRRTAAQCLGENLHVAAAYLARRSFALERSPGALLAAAALGWRCWWRAPAGERGRVARMFLQGPVKALGVRPA